MANYLLQIEVGEAGLNAARAEVKGFLAYVSGRPGESAAIAYVVIRKLSLQIEQAIEQREAAIRARRPRPVSIREERRRLAA